jgi:outer membrane protein OmpA-like peptidoglycan-associated protein
MTQLEQHANEDHTALEQQRERQQSKLAEAEQARQAIEAELTTRLTEVQQQVEAKARDLTAAEEANKAKEQELADALARVTTLTAEVQQGRDAMTALEQKNEQQLTELRTELEQAGETLAGVQEALSTALAANTEQKDTHQDQLKAAERRIAELEKDLAAAHTTPTQTPADDSSKQEAADVTEPLKTEPAATAALSTPQSTSESTPESSQGPTPTGEQPPPADVQTKTEAPAETEGLADRYAELKAKQTERGMLVILGDDQLHFQTGGAAMPKTKVPNLDRISALLVAFPNLTARIEGYTDSSGADQTNLALSKARAAAVRTVLVARGISPERLTAEGFGKQRPIAENGTPAGRLKNRRIEVYLIEAKP